MMQKNNLRLQFLILALAYLSLSCGITVTGNPKQPDESKPKFIELPPSDSLDMELESWMLTEEQEGDDNRAANLVKQVLAELLKRPLIRQLRLNSQILVDLQTIYPKENADQSWSWWTTTSFENSSYEVDLKGRKTQGKAIDWQLDLTSSGEKNTSWATGLSQSDQGQWIFNQVKGDVKWSYKDKNSRQFSLTWGQDGERGWKSGGSISFHKDQAKRLLTIKKDPNQDRPLEIEWDNQTQSGKYAGSRGIEVCWGPEFKTQPCDK